MIDRAVRALRIACTLLATIGLMPGPAIAQSADPDAELKGLIPDEAVRDPEAWARQGVPGAAAAEPEAPSGLPEVDPGSPLAEDEEFSLPWPEDDIALPALVSLEPDPEIAALLAEDGAPPERDAFAGNAQRISPQLALVLPTDPAQFPVRAEFVARFAALSAIERLAREGEANPAQLAARARADVDLLRRLLQIYGYYDATVIQTVGGGATGEGAALRQPSVRLDIVPGPRYRFGAVALGDLPGTGSRYAALRSAHGIGQGDPLDSDRIVASRASLDTALAESGYAFATLGEPSLTIDHGREEGDLDQPVKSGGRFRIAGVTSSLPRFLPASHLAEIARFKTGDLYKRSEVEDLRRAIVATGLVSSVTVVPRETRAPAGETPGDLTLDVALAPAKLRTVAGAIGYDSGEGFRLEASWEHRNLFPPEGLLRVRGVAGTKEQLVGVTFRRNNFRGRDRVLTADLYANSVKRDAYVARTLALSATYEQLTTLIFQKPWVWSLGLEGVATNEREGDVGGVRSARQIYYVAALPLRIALDTTDDLLDPTKGFRAGLRVSPELSFTAGRKSAYARVQADGSAYLPVGKRVVLAGRVRLGSIPGADLDDIAPSRRFYAGGVGSVRGFGFQEIGPRDSLGELSGGRSLSEFSIEARVKTGLFGGGLSLVPFLDAGTVEPTATPRFRGMRFGAGLGLRYQTGFGPIRVDVATPLNRRPGEAPVAVYVALGQAF